MFSFRTSIGPVDLAFTDRFGGVSAPPFDQLNLAVGSADPAVPSNVALVRDAFGPDDAWVHLRQVHGRTIHHPDLPNPDLAHPADPSPLFADRAHISAERAHISADRAQISDDSALPEADGSVTASPGWTLSVRVADCVPVLLADPQARVIAAVHAGRAGVHAGIAPAAVAEMRLRGAVDIQAWIGPHVCGSCYEVPPDLQAEVLAAVPEARAETSWGTPALDLGAGVRAQLERIGVTVDDVSRCTRESSDLYSYRRDGTHAGRFAGIIRLRA